MRRIQRWPPGRALHSSLTSTSIEKYPDFEDMSSSEKSQAKNMEGNSHQACATTARLKNDQTLSLQFAPPSSTPPIQSPKLHPCMLIFSEMISMQFGLFALLRLFFRSIFTLDYSPALQCGKTNGVARITFKMNLKTVRSRSLSQRTSPVRTHQRPLQWKTRRMELGHITFSMRALFALGSVFC